MYSEDSAVRGDGRTLAEAFPEIPVGSIPLGPKVMVQYPVTKTKSKGGIILTNESREYEKWNNQVAKVVALGDVAYKDRDTFEVWPEGPWVKVGDYVRVPKNGGDKYELDVPGREGEKVIFGTYNDREMISKITLENPLDMINVF